MSLKIKNIISKKGNEFPALVFMNDIGHDVILTFDVRTISRVSGLSIKAIYLLEDDYIIL